MEFEPETEPELGVALPEKEPSQLYELLQSAMDGLFPSDQKLEELIDRWESMP